MNSNENNAQNRIVAKLRSERGASITFALLLFLVCAALSAVILVAATTASGRMAGIAETDQRYYSVTSAAELFAYQLDDKTITRVKLEEEEDYWFFEKPASEVTESDFTNKQEKKRPLVDPIAEGYVNDIDSSIISGSLNTEYRSDSFIGRITNMSLGNEGTSNTVGQIAFVASGLSEDVRKYLKIEIKGEKLRNNLLLDIYNYDDPNDESDDSGRFTLILDYSLNKRVFDKVLHDDSEDFEFQYLKKDGDVVKERDIFPLKEVNGKKIKEVSEITLNLNSVQLPYDYNPSEDTSADLPDEG